MLADYAAHLRDLVDLTRHPAAEGRRRRGQRHGRPHRPDGASTGLPLDLVPMYFELDGTFPNHEANPLDPKNIVDLQARVREEGADLGLAFDGDADRCFVVDERGEPVSPSAITALVAARELAKHPGGTVIHNLITSHGRCRRSSASTAACPVRTRVGHSFIKEEMAKTGADLRRRALRALLLPRLLERRHRHAGRAARAGRARRAGRPAVRRWSRTTTATRRPARSTPRSPTRPGRLAAIKAAYGGRDGVDARRAGRPHGRPAGRLVVQPPRRPTPSRCCGSTSRPPTRPPSPRCATRSWRS